MADRESTSILRELVSRPSVNPMGRALQSPDLLEHRVTDYLEQFYRGLGVPYERQHVAPQRENIVARTASGSKGPSIVFEAHQDTVPTDNMTIDPFGAKIEKGRLYGRGACDIKGGMASMLAAFARLVREKPKGAAEILMACTVDEEHTFLGVQQLVKNGLVADMAVVAEPTCMKIVHAHKGVCRWHLMTTGRSCHSSAPEQGINAIYRMGKVLVGVDRFADWLRASRTDALLGSPTLSIGRIEGGTSVNTVPDRCRVEVDRRLIPGEDPQAAPGQLTTFLKNEAHVDVPFEVSPLFLHCPALSPERSKELVARLGSAVASVRGKHEVTAVPYGTDASTIAATGIPSVVFGPGDIAQAHTCDEWIDLDEVESASEVLFRLACGT
jgi:acetylornithine deacetylase